MDLPFTKIIVDSRHAANGDASAFDISLPESITLPPNAVVYTTDITVPHLFANMGSGQSLRNIFYFVERVGQAHMSIDCLNRAVLDETKTSDAKAFADELKDKINAASILGSVYDVAHSDETGTMTISLAQASGTVNSFYPIDDDLLGNPSFQSMFNTQTGTSLTPWIANYDNPQSCMQLLGLGPRSSLHTSRASLVQAIFQDSLLTSTTTGAVDIRRNHSICLHSPTLTNYKCLGPAGSRSILARLNVTSGYGSILHQQHSGHVLDYNSCGGVTLQTIRFELRNADNEPVDMRGAHISFTLLFAAAPLG